MSAGEIDAGDFIPTDLFTLLMGAATRSSLVHAKTAREDTNSEEHCKYSYDFLKDLPGWLRIEENNETSQMDACAAGCGIRLSDPCIGIQRAKLTNGQAFAYFAPGRRAGLFLLGEDDVAPGGNAR